MGDPHAEDAFWRRPPGWEHGAGQDRPDTRSDNGPDTWSGRPVGHPGPVRHPPGSQPAYQGPPRTTPPPSGWRPPTVVNPPAPRTLPPQNLSAIDREEQAARTVTLGVGLVAGAILLVLTLVLCGRWLF
jgi:hypothetical protein